MSAAAPDARPAARRWQLEPGLIGAAASLAACSYGVERAASQRALGRSCAPCSFIAGLLVLAMALLSGIDSYSERAALGAHAFSTCCSILLAPTLLLCGAPVRLALRSCSPRGTRALGGMLRRVGSGSARGRRVGFVLFAIVMLATHLTGVFELALRDPTVHALEHAAYFWTGIALPRAR